MILKKYLLSKHKFHNILDGCVHLIDTIRLPESDYDQ